MLKSSKKPERVMFFFLLLVIIVTACGHAGEPSSSLFKDFKWRSLGPSATGGRIIDVAVDPKNKSIIYAASASGGLWKSINNGTTWTCVFQHEGTLSIGDVAVDPKKTGTVWVGTGEANNQRSCFWGDGIYKSTDGGKTWTNMGLRDSHHISRIVINPSNTNIVYVAVPGHLYTPNKERGLFKTTNGGKSWEKVLYINEWIGVIDVVINPKKTETLYAATYERLRRAWNFDGAGPGSAIYKSTDGGKKWSKLSGGLPTGEIGRIGLALFPGNPEILYADVSNQNLRKQVDSGKEFTAAGKQGKPRKGKKGKHRKGKKVKQGKKEIKAKEPAHGDFRTPFGIWLTFEGNLCRVTSVDKGGTAEKSGILKGDILEMLAGQKVSNPWDLSAILLSFRKGDLVKLVINRNKIQKTFTLRIPRPRDRMIGREIYCTRDGGRKWEKRNIKSIGIGSPYYFAQIRVDPRDENRVYVLDVPIYTSDDGGKNWSSKLGHPVHVDHHAFWIDPDNTDRLLLGNDGGLYQSYDRGATWDYIFNLSLSQFYAVGVDMQRPYHVYGGLQDNGSYGGPSRSRCRSGIGRYEWYRIGGGDGFYVQVAPEDHNIIISESQFGFINRLDRKTGRRKSIRPPQSDPGGPRDRYNWNSPILLSHHNSRTLYFAGNKLFKSYNRGDDWLVISPDLTTADPAKISGNVPHCTITTVAESPIDPNVLLVGTDDGNIQWTDTGGKTWIKLNDRFPFAPASWWVTRVELSHHDINTAYVSCSAFRDDDFRPFVFMTSDRGKTWEPVCSNLPEGPVNVIKEDPVNPNLLFVGTDFGVFFSLDKGNKWTPLCKDLPRVSVQDLLVHPRDRDLVIGTHGRGIFIMDISPLEELSDEVLKKDAYLFSIKNGVKYHSKPSANISGNRRLISQNPPYGAVIFYYLKSGIKKEEISLGIFDTSGKKIKSLKPDPSSGIHHVVWNLREADMRGRQGGKSNAKQNLIYRVILKVRGKEFIQLLTVEDDPGEQ